MLYETDLTMKYPLSCFADDYTLQIPTKQLSSVEQLVHVGLNIAA
jgi:hypothetical protein